VLQFFSAGGDFGGAALQFGEFDETALVEIDERRRSVKAVSILRSSRVSSAASSSSSGIGWSGDGLLAGQQLVEVGDRGADVVEHEGVECVGADVAFGTAAGFAAGADGVVVAAVVIAVPGAVAVMHLCGGWCRHRRRRI
jgi:hypothetical protein